MAECSELRIGGTFAGLRQLRYRGISEPDSFSYNPYSTVVTDGAGLPRGYGFPVASWTWDALSQDEVNKLLDFFATDTDAGVSLYITTYIDVGRGTPTLDDFTANMLRPIDGDGKQVYARTGGKVYSDITVQFTHLVPA